ncbi:MAG: hypothetical protein QNJ18_09705 [Xenococcaceae cyanobacterium MO_167.B52]|nr:hypothetical protein [Xenococcaceae cyanobacterium MO_167.B52]
MREVGKKFSNQTIEIAIAGGVIGATLIALYFVPSAYYLLKSRVIRDRLSVGITKVSMVKPSP